METYLHAHTHVCDHGFFCIGRFWLQNTQALSWKVASRWLQLSLLLQSWAAPRSILSVQRQQETCREAGADRSAIAAKLLGSQATSALARRGQGLQSKSQPSPEVESQDVFIPCFISESSGHIPPRREEGRGNFCRAPLSRVTEPLSLQSS